MAHGLIDVPLFYLKIGSSVVFISKSCAVELPLLFYSIPLQVMRANFAFINKFHKNDSDPSVKGTSKMHG
jgi:hypothetical protein